MGEKKTPDPAVAPPPPKVPLIIKVVDGFERPLAAAEVEVVNLLDGPKKQTDAKGIANFGPVDPRRKFDIKVRKSSFGPPGNLFTPGENRVVRRASTNPNTPIVMPLTQNLASLRIVVVGPAPKEEPVSGATIGIDGITGALPLPVTDAQGKSQFFPVPPGQFRFHAQKNGFGPEPVGSAKFQKDQDVVGFRTLVDGEFATEKLHLTRFVAKLTVLVVSPPAAGGLSGPDVPLDDAEVGVDGVTGATFVKTKNGGKVTVEIPAGQDLHFRARKNGFGKATSSGDVVNFSFDEGDVKALADNEEKEVTLRLAEAGQVTPVISPTPALPAGDAIILLVKKPHTTPKRWQVNFKADSVFGGTGVLRMENPSGSVKVFRSATGTDEVPFDAKKEITLVTNAVTAGTNLFIEAAGATAKVGDLKLTLELRGGTRLINPPVSIKVTCVELKLDICKSRTSATADPDPMSEADKINVGRFVHVQDSGATKRKHRAMLIVRKPTPADFAGTLTLKPIVPARVGGSPVLLFDKDSEVAPGHAALGNPFEFAAALDAAAAPKFFVEGTATSSKINETGYTLGIKGIDENQGDRVSITVFEVEKVEVKLARTRCRGVAAGDMPATVVRTDTTAFDAATPTVVRECGNLIMEATVKPATVKLSWDVQRAADDAASLTGLPTHADNGAPNKRKVTANATGSFHVFAFVDANGSGTHGNDEDGVAVNLNMVEVKVPVGAANNQIFRSPAYSNAGSSAGMLVVHSGASQGTFSIAPSIGGAYGDAEFLRQLIGFKVTVNLIGGGADQRRGVDKLTLGYNQTTTADSIVGAYVDGRTERETLFVMPIPPANLGPGGQVVSNPALPTLAFSVRDTRGTANSGTGPFIISSSDANPADKKNLPAGGEQRVVRMIDTPAIAIDMRHPVTHSALASIAGSNNFEVFLCAMSSDFNENYTAIATAAWSTTYGNFTAAGGWAIAGAALTAAATMTVFTPAQPGDKVAMERCPPNFVDVIPMDAR